MLGNGQLATICSFVVCQHVDHDGIVLRTGRIVIKRIGFSPAAVIDDLHVGSCRIPAALSVRNRVLEREFGHAVSRLDGQRPVIVEEDEANTVQRNHSARLDILPAYCGNHQVVAIGVRIVGQDIDRYRAAACLDMIVGCDRVGVVAAITTIATVTTIAAVAAISPTGNVVLEIVIEIEGAIIEHHAFDTRENIVAVIHEARDGERSVVVAADFVVVAIAANVEGILAVTPFDHLATPGNVTDDLPRTRDIASVSCNHFPDPLSGHKSLFATNRAAMALARSAAGLQTAANRPQERQAFSPTLLGRRCANVRL